MFNNILLNMTTQLKDLNLNVHKDPLDIVKTQNKFNFL
jgi:hypothetical protein